MISASTFAFALVSVAAACAALVWIIWLRLTAGLASLRSTLTTAVVKLQRRQEETANLISELRRAAPSTLAAEVADLANAVEKLRLTHRRFAGRFDQYVTQREHAPVANGDAGPPVHDPELIAELSLQSAPPVRPGSR